MDKSQNTTCGFRTYVLSLLAITLWGLSYVWSDRLLSQGIPVEYFVFVRVLLAGGVLLVFNLVAGKDMRIGKGDWWTFALLSFCEPLVYFVCETYGIDLTESPTYSALIIASTPIFSIIAGRVFFKERSSLVNIIGIFLCLGGLVMVTLCASSVGKWFVWGVLLLLVAVFAEVGHASCTKVLSKRYDPVVIVMYQFLFGSVYLLPLFLTRGMRSFDASLYLSWNVWGPVICLAVFCSSLAFSLWVSTIKRLGVARSSIFLALIPIVTAVAGALLGTEHMGLLQWGGIVIALCGVVMSQLKIAQKNG